jgi:capsule polysaccharide export protein KpsC/LpsZ
MYIDTYYLKLKYGQCYCESLCTGLIWYAGWYLSEWRSDQLAKDNKLERFLQETSVQMIHLFYNSKTRLTYFIVLYEDSNTWY